MKSSIHRGGDPRDLPGVRDDLGRFTGDGHSADVTAWEPDAEELAHLNAGDVTEGSSHGGLTNCARRAPARRECFQERG
jgi:hypothetical protein